MELYCVSKNAGPTWTTEKYMMYIGISLDEALKTVGAFVEFEKPFPLTQYPSVYSVLPLSIEKEYVKFYEDEGWWASIAKFTITSDAEFE